MGASASVIQEYYKAVDYWADIAGNRDWKLSVWIVGQNDVDLVDRFLEIERSPVGRFDDIFFRFDTPYKGDDEEYAEQLWQEYAGWFSEKVEEKYDILRALRHDGLLREEYTPDVSVLSSGTGKGVLPDRMVRQCAERGRPAGNPDDNH